MDVITGIVRVERATARHPATGSEQGLHTAMVTGPVTALSRVQATSPGTAAMRKSPVMAGTWAR